MARPEDTGVAVQAVAHVRDAIRSGRFGIGAHIRERQIADELGISSIAVREAFARLAQEGWIERLPRRGVRVRLVTAAGVADISAVRALLEGEAAARASERISTADVDHLNGLVIAMGQAASRSDRSAMFDLDDAFHVALWRLADSPTLEEILRNLRARIAPLVRLTIDSMLDSELPTNETLHAELLAAVQEGRDVARAEAARHADITRVRTIDALAGLQESAA